MKEVKVVKKIEAGGFQDPLSDQDVCEQPTPKVALGHTLVCFRISQD